MQIVIDIPTEIYEASQILDVKYEDTVQIPLEVIANGTPLPEGHGKLKDVDKIEWYGCTTAFDCPYKERECKDCNKAKCSKTQVDDIPTIIEADKEE